VLSALIAVVTIQSAVAADWPAWRGPNRDAISTEKGLLKTWPEGGPKLLWTFEDAGQGYAGMAVVGGTVYTMGARGEDEYLIAVDGKGKEIWSTKIGPVFDFKQNAWSRGPNATPTVDGDLIFALSSKGVLLCANKAKGKKVWSIDIPKELDGEVNNVAGFVPKFGWGYTWSALVDGNNLIIVPGGPKGLFAALDKKSGKLLWRSKDVTDQATYASPIAATIGGVRQYLYLTQKTLYSVSAKDGALLWKHSQEEEYPDVVCGTPIVKDDRVYISVGNGGKNELLKITSEGGKFKAEQLWRQNVIGNKQGGVALVDGYLYGYHEDRNWACVDFKTGKRIWPTRSGKQNLKEGGFVIAEGRLYTLDEKGKVGMIEVTPKGYIEIATFDLPKQSTKRKSNGRVWNYPTLSDGKLYVRDQELLFCYEVK